MTGNSEIQRAAAASEVALAPFAILGTAPEAAYDELAQLAADLCDAPVALVTLFEGERQFFKAAHGFAAAGTALEDALCANALHADDVLVIPDLSADARTCGNAFVADGPQARFYAGAPLRTDDGTFLGTLCVLDMAARPAGLTANQLSGLRTLARQVMSLLELRRLLLEREASIAAQARENRRLRASEEMLSANAAHWRGLFEGLREGFIVGEIVRDPAGRAIDWRHLEANAAFQDVVGLPASQVIGRTMREVAPEVPARWIAFIAAMVASDQPATFAHLPGRGARTYEGRAFPIGGDQFAVIFLDVTERTAAERRREALLAIGDRLRDLDTIPAMIAAAIRLLGETLGCKRVGYGRLDAAQTMLDVEQDWTARGIASVAGLHRFADYGDLLNELLVGQPLVIRDVRTDPRTAPDPAPMLALAIMADVHMPIRERGRTVAVLFVHDDCPRDWSGEELAFLREVGDRLEAALARVDSEKRRAVQNEELSHRLKNTLAMVQAIASQTLKSVSERALVQTFERRLSALATAHDVLLTSAWEVAVLDDVIRSVLDTAGQDGRVTLTGPTVNLAPRAVLSLSLLVHELATNALKYGALSVPAGSVAVDWAVRNRDGRPTLFLEWVEHGGPPVTPPTRTGFGSRLIKLGLAGTGGVELGYGKVGFSARMSAPLDDLTKT